MCVKWTLIYVCSRPHRNFTQIMRILDSCQLTAKEQVATPLNWQQGGDIAIAPAVSDEEGKNNFPVAGKPRCAKSA